MDLKNRQAIRLHESITNTADAQTADAILEQLPLSKTATENKKYEWVCNSLELLNEQFDEETVTSIRKGCHCHPSTASVKAIKKLWDASENMADFAERCNSTEPGFKLECEGSNLVLVYPMCYCSFVNKMTKPVPAAWCMCSVGYAEDMFASVTGRPVRAELIESVKTGGNGCRISIIIE